MTTHNTDTDIITIEVTLEKTDFGNPKYSLAVNGVEADFNYRTSKLLLGTRNENSNGIFTTERDGSGAFSKTTVICFTREDTKVEVDLGGYWEPSSYVNPAQEIKRRVQAVNAAFDAVKEAYTKVWTVEL